MSGFANKDLQIAVYDALQSDVTLEGLVGDRIFDIRPEDETYPYVTLGEDRAQDRGYKDGDAQTHTFMVNAWSENGGHISVKEIMAAIYNVLQRATLTVSGQTLIDLRCELSESLSQQDEAGFYFRGVMRFRAITYGT